MLTDRLRDMPHTTLHMGGWDKYPMDINPVIMDEVWKALVESRRVAMGDSDVISGIRDACKLLKKRAPDVTLIGRLMWLVCPPDTAARLGIGGWEGTAADIPMIGLEFHRVCLRVIGQLLDTPYVIPPAGEGPLGPDNLPGLTLYEPGRKVWWILRPRVITPVGPTAPGGHFVLEWHFSVQYSVVDPSTRISIDCEELGVEPSGTTANLAKTFLWFRLAATTKIKLANRGYVPDPATQADFLAQTVINRYEAARTAPGGPLDLDAAIAARLRGRDLRSGEL